MNEIFKRLRGQKVQLVNENILRYGREVFQMRPATSQAPVERRIMNPMTFAFNSRRL